MGTCGSKCCFTSPTPSISDPGSPHDKTVIFSDPLPLTTPPPPPKDPLSDSPKNDFKFQIHPCPPIPSSSSSSTTPTSSSISTSTTTTSSTVTSYCSSYSTTNSSYSTDMSFDSRPNHSDSAQPPLKKKSLSNGFLLSCVENSNIVILDPMKGIEEKPTGVQISKFSEIPVTSSQYLTTSSLRQRASTSTSMINTQANNAKRARSISPASRTGRKVIKPDPGSWNPVSSKVTGPRTGDLKPPQWRPVNSRRGSLNVLSGPVSRSISAIKRNPKGPTMEKEEKEREIQDGEVASRERVKTPPPVEDLNNPLIAMDCFIFL